MSSRVTTRRTRMTTRRTLLTTIQRIFLCWASPSATPAGITVMAGTMGTAVMVDIMGTAAILGILGIAGTTAIVGGNKPALGGFSNAYCLGRPTGASV